MFNEIFKKKHALSLKKDAFSTIRHYEVGDIEEKYLSKICKDIEDNPFLEYYEIDSNN